MILSVLSTLSVLSSRCLSLLSFSLLSLLYLCFVCVVWPLVFSLILAVLSTRCTCFANCDFGMFLFIYKSSETAAEGHQTHDIGTKSVAQVSQTIILGDFPC